MNLKHILSALLFGTAMVANAQSTCDDLEYLPVNEQLTTIITASEPIRFVDISTDKIAGDQPIENTVRLKPKEDAYTEGELLAVVTVVTERYRTQYGLVYTADKSQVITDKSIALDERRPYNNPAISMSAEDMYTFARKVWNSPVKYRNVGKRRHKIQMNLNNIYAVGDYFFIDFSLYNSTNIRFDIDEIRISLADKKVSKATTTQVIELKPEIILDKAPSFKNGYRNVIVIKKLTFPNDKMLTLRVSEKQISGRSIAINIDYKKILEADSFSKTLLKSR